MLRNHMFRHVQLFSISNKLQSIEPAASQMRLLRIPQQTFKHYGSCRKFSSGKQLHGLFDFWSKKEQIVESESNILTHDYPTNVVDATTSLTSEFQTNTDPITTVSETIDYTSVPVEAIADVAVPVASKFSLWPPTVVQDILCYVHDASGVEWCGTIAIATVCLRLLTLPTYALVRGFSIRSANAKPGDLKIQKKIREAQLRGDKFQQQHYQLELMEYWQENNVSPLKGMLYHMPNALLFCSMFMALRNMTRVPLASMTDAGYLWFPNLTIPDPYFVLPALSCATMFLLIKTGGGDADMGPMANQESLKKIIQFVPLVTLPFVCIQPAAIATYWLTNNAITLVFINAFKTSPLKKLFGLPEVKQHSEQDLELMKNEFQNVFKGLKGQSNSQHGSFEERMKQHKRMVEATKKIDSKKK